MDEHLDIPVRARNHRIEHPKPTEPVGAGEPADQPVAVLGHGEALEQAA